MPIYMFRFIHARKYLRFVFENQVFQFMALPLECPCPWIFTKLMDVIAAHLHQCAISRFPYLEDWPIRDQIHSRLISHTIYCLQTVQSKSQKGLPLDTTHKITKIRGSVCNTVVCEAAYSPLALA